MRIGFPRQTRPGELRVAITPLVARDLIAADNEVIMETGAGERAGYQDAQYREVGVEIGDRSVVDAADLMAMVTLVDPLPLGNSGQVWLGLLEPLEQPELMSKIAESGVTTFAFEAVPRITRAQPMDALSSQATAAGYQAVLVGAAAAGRFLPMLTTAAGTIPPATVVVLGVGVAGLQAIATAHRLGAVVSAFDVRAAAAEQVMSLGAKFIDLEIEQQDSSTSGGYARQVAEDTQTRIISGLIPYLSEADLVISTAAIPGRAAPLLIDDSSLAAMKAGSVIVDLAAATGGNCAQTKSDETVAVNGVTIIGDTNLVSGAAYDASRMYAKNVASLLGLLTDSDANLNLDFSDEIIEQSCITHSGEVKHPRVRSMLGLADHQQNNSSA